MRNFGAIDDAGVKKLGAGRKIALSVIFTVFAFALTVLQTANIRFFGQVPDILLALVCAVAFIYGGGAGAMLGLLCGVLAVTLGGSGFTLAPVTYVLCGYLCGALVNKVLSSNFVSFIAFGAAAGLIKEVFTLIYFGLISNEFDLILLIKNVIIGEYFAYLVCVIPAYFAIFAIYLLFKGKDEGSRRVR